MDWQSTRLARLKAWVRRRRANFWSSYYHLNFRLRWLLARFGWQVMACLFLAALVVPMTLAFVFEGDIRSIVDEAFDRNSIVNLLLTLGGALATASAIVFSLIIFSVQVNVERLPHRLFQRFGFDYQLIAFFIATFAISIVVAGSTLFLSFETTPFIIIGTIWGVATIGAMFLFAFKRALDLINPLLQIKRVRTHAQRHMQWWDRFFDRFTLAWSESREEARDDRRDPKRAAALKLHGDWTDSVQRDVEQLVAISNRSAEIGDHQIARGALNALDAIHAAYIKTKGLTFFASNPFFDVGESTDVFFNHTLESIRQALQQAIARGDEKQAEYCFETYAALAHRCLRIDYGVDYASKTHANLAVGYLARGIEASVQMKSPDVLMIGARYLGGVGQGLVEHGRPSEGATVVDNLSTIAAVGALQAEYQPVTLTAVEQYQYLTVKILLQDDRDIGFTIGRIFHSLSFIGRLLIKKNEAPFQSPASSSLAPYFSMTSMSALHQYLMRLANGIIEDKIKGDHAANFTRNFAEWFEEGREVVKGLMVEAFKHQSQLGPDIVTWIKGQVEIALALSNDDACPDHTKEVLRKQAQWWVWVLTFIPDEKEAVALAETYQFTNTLFEIGMMAQQRECEDVFTASRETMAYWCVKAAKHETGQAILETSIYALVAMSIVAEGSGAIALDLVRIELENKPLTEEVKKRAARNIRQRPHYRNDGYARSRVDRAMREVDQNELQETLTSMANLLDPPR